MLFSVWSDAKEASLEELKPYVTMYRNRINSNQFEENSLAVIVIPLQDRIRTVQELFSAANYKEWLTGFVESFEKLLIDMVILEVSKSVIFV